MPSLIETSNTILGAFRRFKFVTVACIAGFFIGLTAVFVYATAMISQAQKTVYVVDSRGQAFSATQQQAGFGREDEIRDQSVKFHELFFNITPNNDIIRRNVERALEISDRSVYSYYNTLQEQGYYKQFVSANATQQIVVDSVRVNMRVHPYQVRTYATEYLTRESVMSKNTLVTQCSMLEVNRSEKNVHGLQIEQFEVLENRTVETRRR